VRERLDFRCDYTFIYEFTLNRDKINRFRKKTNNFDIRSNLIALSICIYRLVLVKNCLMYALRRIRLKYLLLFAGICYLYLDNIIIMWYTELINH